MPRSNYTSAAVDHSLATATTRTRVAQVSSRMRAAMVSVCVLDDSSSVLCCTRFFARLPPNRCRPGVASCDAHPHSMVRTIVA